MTMVLFVCTGNICRSPTAEGVFRRMIEEAGLVGRVGTDSAGTESFHVGEPPDARSCQAARARGYPIDDLRARQIRPRDFESFDLILAMDRGHLSQLRRLCPPDLAGRLKLFLDYAPWAGASDVPDPYYGGPGGFTRVLDLIEAGCRGVLEAVERQRR
ncbi:MAG: low molecular weight protein-tyrosine-phosphatase [Rhodospirillaceae bacterium]